MRWFFLGNNKSSVSYSYISLIAIGSFSLAITFSIISELLVRNLNNLALTFIILLVIIFTGVIFDMLGTAVTAANESPFHAKAAKRVLGAQQGIMLIRNADRVANISNDVIGDIAGTVSGALGISIVARIALQNKSWDAFILNILITACVASLTITGKALGKKFALDNCDKIIFFVGKLIAHVEKTIGRDPFRKNRRNK
jgi:Mg2+/Co2+ transporter CorB